VEEVKYSENVLVLEKVVTQEKEKTSPRLCVPLLLFRWLSPHCEEIVIFEKDVPYETFSSAIGINVFGDYASFCPCPKRNDFQRSGNTFGHGFSRRENL
jgi:hypothetical protein